ncbi:MAG: response regulator [Chloroflexi bacterium]|nr:response regulator [Chloroflexota bacterium]
MPKKLRILIVDDDKRMAETLVDILNSKDFHAEAAFSGPEALDLARERQFDSLLTDIKMPDMNGVELYRAFHLVQPNVPVVFMTAYTSDDVVQEGIDEGAIGVLDKPLDINLLLNFFSSVIDERPVVIVDDDPDFCKTVGDILQESGYSVSAITDIEDIEQLISQDFQLVLLDMKLNHLTGLEVLKIIKSKSPSQPVVLVTGYQNEMAASIETALKLSAHTCLYKPLEIDKLFGVINEIHNLELSRIISDES